LVLGDNAIDVQGVDGFTVRESRFFGWAAWGIIANRASGRIIGNHAARVSVAAGVHAGPTNHRSRLTIEDNRFVENAGGGLLINSTALLLPGSSAPTEAVDGAIEAVVRHNDLSGNVLSAFFSFGLRV
jgi:hypothetical protein